MVNPRSSHLLPAEALCPERASTLAVNPMQLGRSHAGAPLKGGVAVVIDHMALTNGFGAVAASVSHSEPQIATKPGYRFRNGDDLSSGIRHRGGVPYRAARKAVSVTPEAAGGTPAAVATRRHDTRACGF